MFKFKLFGDDKFLVDSKGKFIKNADGENVPAPKDAEEFVETADDSKDEDSAEVEELKALFKEVATENAKEALKAMNMKEELAKSTKEAFADVVNASKKADTSLNVEKTKEGFAFAKSAIGKSFEVSVKELSELNSLTGDVVEEDRKAGITRDPQRAVFMEDLATSEGTNSDKVSWVEVVDETGAPATTAELATFAEKDYEFGVFSADVVKVTVMSKASNEILEDAPQLVSFVRNSLIEDLNLKVDEKLLSGTGVSDITGVLATAPAFTGGALAGTLTAGTATKADVLRTAIMEIVVAGKGKFRATEITLSPIDATALDLEKGTDGHYIMPPFATADRSVIKGVSVMENTGITAGTFLVGDFTKLHVANRRGLSLQVATENQDDFEKDMITMRLSRRLASYIRTNEIGAFVQGDFASAITALEV